MYNASISVLSEDLELLTTIQEAKGSFPDFIMSTFQEEDPHGDKDLIGLMVRDFYFCDGNSSNEKNSLTPIGMN